MASARRSAQRKPKRLSKGKISEIASSGKALDKDELYGRVYCEVMSTYKAFLDTCPQDAAFVEKQKRPVTELLKRSSVELFDLFSGNVGRSLDKCALFRVKWYEHVRDVLGSQEVMEIVWNVPSDQVNRDVVISVLSCYVESLWNVSAKFIMERQGYSETVDSKSRTTSEDTVSLLKLGSAAVLSVKKRLHKAVNDGKPAKGLKKELVREVLAIDKMEDIHKKNLPHFVKKLDEGTCLC